MSFQYDVGSSGCRFDIDTGWAEDSPDYIAEEAAKDYYENHDGWEASWPQNITIYKGDNVLGKFEVNLEHEPTFSANEI